MISVAVLGYGTVGSGVVEVFRQNQEKIDRCAGDQVRIKYVLDLRDFPEDPVQELIVHDFEKIVSDESVDIVVEVMGGLEPAYTFVKRSLEAGKNVVTSNKALVAAHGAELLKTAKENHVNYLFEASVGVGIPIIRPLTQCLTADVIEEISGILNGTTNYMLTKMEEEGIAFDEVLKEAQEKGYAELHPEADIEGYDACRKIAILTSLAYGKQVDFEDVHTEGITNISAEDFQYARQMKKCIKLLGKSWSDDGKLYAMVCPMLIDHYHPLAGVKDVFNAIFVHGNMVDDTMFYGRGAGKLPTASAVAADVVDCVKHMGTHIKMIWEQEKLPLSDFGGFERRYFVRMPKEVSLESVEKAFGAVEPVKVDGIEETAFVTGVMKESDYHKAADQFDDILNMIRIDA